MLVAKKDYLETSEEQNIERKPTQKVKKKRIVKKRTVKTFRTLFCIAIFFMMGFVIVLRYVTLTELSNLVDKQQKYLSGLEKTNSQLKAELVIDLKTVDKIAKNELGMVEPYDYQTVYVNIDKSNKLKNKEDKSNKSKFKVVKKLSRIVEYLY